MRYRIDVFPARAGMSLRERPRSLTWAGFPRPRGDEPLQAALNREAFWFSPPARG